MNHKKSLLATTSKTSSTRTIILGIDPGTTITGYGVLAREGNAYEALDFGSIKPPAKALLSTRYLIIFDSLLELIDTFKPTEMAIETQYVKHNIQSAIKLGMARGSALLAAKKKGLSVYGYAPSRAKLAVVGTGSASKQQVQGMVQRLLNLSLSVFPEDAADALALAICHAQNKNGEEM